MKKDEDKWIKNLRARMEDYSEPLPLHGWEDLEKALTPSPKVILLWRTPRFVAAAAVFVAAVSSVSVWMVSLPSENGLVLSPAVPDKMVTEKASEDLFLQKALEEQTMDAVSIQEPAQRSVAVASSSDRVVYQRMVQAESGLAPVVAGDDDRPEEVHGQAPVEDLPAEILPDEEDAGQEAEAADCNRPTECARVEREENRRIMEYNRMSLGRSSEKEKGKWAVGVNTGNMPYAASETYGGFSGMTLGRFAMPIGENALTATNNVNSAYKQVLFNNRDKETWTDAHHKMPVTVGASVKWNFAPQWALETGVNYTYLESEFRSGSEASYWNKMQKLHYIGIPVKVHRQVWENRWLSVYAAAGGMVEKCVSGSKDVLVAESAQTQMSEHHSLKVNPLQWSVVASVGAQVKVTQLFGVYLEPGMAYYFDDGSAIETIRKEHPFNFNLQLGLRFSFSR